MGPARNSTVSRQPFRGTARVVGGGGMRADRGLNDRWADLYAVVAPAALGFAFGLCSGDRAAAEDLFHDAFLRCVKRRGATQDHDGFVQYLRRAMVNASIDRSRRDQTRRRWLARQQGE